MPPFGSHNLDPQHVEDEQAETPAPARVRPGTLVAHAHQHPSHGAQVRHGLVAKVHEPVITGVDDQGNDVETAHADVAWFGLDGFTTVPVNDLDPID